MTSNIGAAAMQRQEILPNRNRDKNKELNSRYLKAVQDTLRPELYNRIDEVIPFASLSKETVRYVIDREIQQLQKREGIRYRRMDLNIDTQVLDHLADVGFDEKYGARYLQRTLREQLIIPLSRELNLFDLDDQLMVEISVDKKQIKIDIQADPLGLDLLFEEIEKNDYADLAGGYRRDFQRFQDGYMFTQLMSKLDILNREKDQLKEKFWNEKTRADEYANLLNLQNEATAHASTIEQIETDYSLACMDLKVYQLDWSDQMDIWKDQFFDLKVKVLLQGKASHRHCRFRIFGENLDLLIKFYTPLFEKKGFDFTCQTIWYREDYFSEIVEVKTKKGKTTLKEREEYYIRYWDDTSKKNLAPEKPKDRLIGVEFLLVGNCPQMYLQNEVGQQLWKISDKEEYLYKVDVVQINDPLPLAAHKKSFFEKNNPFRTVSSGHLDDKTYGKKREFGKGNLLDFLFPLMEEQFKLNVNFAVA